MSDPFLEKLGFSRPDSRREGNPRVPAFPFPNSADLRDHIRNFE
tara:strand:+ start:248 stop:379 length:132 start_codon:yes stop_codon:yes gene_type:complete